VMRAFVLIAVFVLLVQVLSVFSSTEYVPTPFGLRPSQCHHRVPSGAVLEKMETGIQVTPLEGKPYLLPSLEECVEFQLRDDKRRAFLKKDNVGGGPRAANADGWLDNAGWYPPSEMGSFTGYYTIPGNPLTTGAQVLFYFIGVENFDNTAVTILQPVLTWGNGNIGWSMASWNCCPFGQTHESDSLTGLKAGQTLYGAIENSGTGSYWTVSSILGNQNVSITVADIGRNFNWCDVTLETYSVTACSQFANGDMTFSQMKTTLMSGQVVYPTWSTSGYPEPTECGGALNVYSSQQIAIQHNPYA